MGFSTGFTGGVALTLSIAYLTAQAHQRNRVAQASSLRAQAFALQSLTDPLPARSLPPTRSEVAAAQRHTYVEVAKDRWNDEVENAIRWVQTTDWDDVREGIEDAVSRLWAAATGQPPKEDVARAVRKVENQAGWFKGRVEEGTAGVSMASRDAYKIAKSKSISVEEAAENKLLEGRLKTKEKLSQASEQSSSLLEMGRQAAQAITSKVKDITGFVEAKATSDLDSLASPTKTPVQRALQQRYERPEAKVNKTVEEALEERYAPMDKRDNTVLRGV